MPRQIKAGETTAARRHCYFHLVGTDGISPALLEVGQPQVSVNGAAFQDAGIGLLIETGFGRYYAILTTGIIGTVGDHIETRFKSASTAECPGDTFEVVSFDPYLGSSGGAGSGSGSTSRAVVLNSTAMSGDILDFHALDDEGRRWNGSAFEETLAANWANYDVPMPEVAGTGHFEGSLPAGIPLTSKTTLVIYRRSNPAAPALGDLDVAIGEIGGEPGLGAIISFRDMTNLAEGEITHEDALAAAFMQFAGNRVVDADALTFEKQQPDGTTGYLGDLNDATEPTTLTAQP